MKILLILVLCIVPFYMDSFSQEGPGKWAAGGYIAFDSYKNNLNLPNSNQENSENFLSLAPRLGYFIDKDILVGLAVHYYGSKMEESNSASGGIYKNNMLSFEPFIRCYMPVYSSVKLYGEFTAYYGFGGNEIQPTKDSRIIMEKYNRTDFGAYLMPGVSFDISEHISLEASLGIIEYGKSKSEPEEANINKRIIEEDFFYASFDLDFLMIGMLIKL